MNPSVLSRGMTYAILSSSPSSRLNYSYSMKHIPLSTMVTCNTFIYADLKCFFFLTSTSPNLAKCLPISSKVLSAAVGNSTKRVVSQYSAAWLMSNTFLALYTAMSKLKEPPDLRWMRFMFSPGNFGLMKLYIVAS